MRLALAIALATSLAASTWGSLAADEFRYFQQNGVTYRDRVVTQRVAIPETQYQDRQETVYNAQHLPAMRTETRTTYVPVTQYALESRTYGVWPFRQPQTVPQWVPRTQWVPQIQTVQIPVQRKQMLPETRTVRAAQTTMRYIDQPRVVERVVMGPGFVPPALDSGRSPQALAAVPSLAPPPENAASGGTVAPGSLAPAAGVPTLAPVPSGSGNIAGNGSVAAPRSVVSATPGWTQPPPVNGIQPYGAAVGTVPTAAPRYLPANVARRESVGGISRMESDPPRYAAPVAPSATDGMYR